jgi:hypothetical protein
MLHMRLKSPTGKLVLSLVVVCLAGAASSRSNRQAADSFQRKLEFIKKNAQTDLPSAKPTQFQQKEINAYFSEKRLKLPDGVETVIFDLRDAAVEANTRVDFERLRKSRPNMNPLLAIFDGVHDCQVVASTELAGPGRVHVRVESVVIDGMKVPKMALEMFIKHYVNPKYPNVSLDGEYQLPARIDSATITPGVGTIIQK